METPVKELKLEVSRLTSADLMNCLTEEELEKGLAAFINELVNQDFDRLVQLLYRIDISEQKLKKILLEKSGENAGDLIARLIIERQLQKIESRKQHGTGGAAPSEEMKW